jgi:CRP-like cAMP-binding protein
LLLQEGDICRYKIFVTQGLLRTYRERDNGTEHIIRFSPENWWSTDLESYNLQAPSKYNIDALEDSEVLLWTKDNFDQLM